MSPRHPSANTPRPRRRKASRAPLPRTLRRLTVGVGLSCATLLTPAAFAQSDAAHQQFLFAYKLLQRGEGELASEAFDDYLGQFPRDEKRGDAMYYRALLMRKGGNNAGAAKMLAAAPKPSLVPAYAASLLEGQVLSDLKRYDAALVALERIDAATLPANVRVSALYLKGLAYRGAGKLDAAAKTLAQAAEIASPVKARAMLDLARVQVLLQRQKDAIQTLTATLDIATGQVAAEAARLAGDLCHGQERYDEAVAFYRVVLNEHPASTQFGPSVLGTLWAQFASGRYQHVLDTQKRFDKSLPSKDRAAATYLVGSSYRELGDHAQAVAVLSQVAQGEGRFPLLEKVLYKLAASQYELGQYEPMNRTIQRLSKLFPQSPLLVDSAFLLATADAKQGNVTRGAARLTQLIEKPAGTPYRMQALLRRASLYETNGQPNAALADYKRYLAEGGTRNATYPQAMLRVVDLAYRLGNHKESQRVAAELLRRPDLTPELEQETLYRGAMAQVKLGQAKSALSTLDLLAKKHPLNPYKSEIAYYRGLLLMSMGKPAEAMPLLLASSEVEALDKPLRINALRLAALHLRSAEQEAQAAKHLRRIEALSEAKALTDDELMFLGKHLLAAGDAQSAARYLALEQGNAEGLYLYGRTQRALQQYEKAINAFGQVVASGSGFELDARLNLAGTYADMGRLERAIGEYQGLINSETSRIAAAALYEMGVTSRSLAQQRLRQDDRDGAAEANEQAGKLFKRLVLLYSFEELSPLPERGYIEIAEIATVQGDQEASRAAYEELITKYPQSEHAVYAKAILAIERQRLGEAKVLLQRVASSADASLGARAGAALKMLEGRS